jgi:hypothetical protein
MEVTVATLNVTVKFPSGHFLVDLDGGTKIAFKGNPGGPYTGSCGIAAANPTVSHALNWSCVGNVGDAFSITGKIGATTVVDPTKDAHANGSIFPGSNGAADTANFQF